MKKVRFTKESPNSWIISRLTSKLRCSTNIKTNGNVVIICQQFHALTLLKESGVTIDKSSSNKIYEIRNTTNINDIFDKHARFLIRYRLCEKNRYLPQIWWLPKLHKNPTKTRLKTAALKCSLKPISKSITAAFKILSHQIESYNNQLQYLSEINTFFDNFKQSASLKGY